MAKITLTINSRVYTVVADADEAYLERLCDYVNDKVKQVLAEGNHVMGEKPMVLAALNICDEYFKLLDSMSPDKNFSEVIAKNRQLEEELRQMRKDDVETANEIRKLKDEKELYNKMLNESDEQIKDYEKRITELEGHIKKQRSEFALREKELLDMLENR